MILDSFLLSPQVAHPTLLKLQKQVMQMTSLGIVVSEKLPHAVQSYKARSGSRGWERS